MNLPAAVEPFRPQAVAVLHLACSDPRSPLRLPLPLPASLRTALTAQLGARGATLVEGGAGFSSFHKSGAQAVQAAVEILAQGTALLVDESAPVALRAVLAEVRENSEAGQAEALTQVTRLAGYSRDQTLLVTRGLFGLLDKPLAERARLAVAPSLSEQHPDLEGLTDLFDLDWRAALLKPAGVTGSPDLTDLPPARERLELSHGGRELSLDAGDCPFSLGRDKSCALRLDGDVASRVHGHIEFTHGKFYFSDDSRNGTYLLTPQGEEVFLHRERLPLLGRGVISPGAPIVKQSGEVVRYACRSADTDTAATPAPDGSSPAAS